MLKAKEDMKITRFKTNLLSILKGIRGWDALNFIYWNGNDPLQKMHFIRFVSLKPLKTINLKVTNCSPSRAGGRFEMQCITSPPNSTHPETSQLCL